MHPLIDRCRAVMDSADPEPVLAVIDGFPHDPPDAHDQLVLARDLLPRRHYQAAETLLWRILCLAEDRFPRPEQIAEAGAILRSIPADYGASRRLTTAVELLGELPAAAHELFRWRETIRRADLQPLMSPDHVPGLIRIIETRPLYPKDSPGFGWAPIHALRILAELQAAEAIVPMLEGMFDPEIFDYALKELAFALGRMGARALDATVGTLRRPGMDEFQIITLLRVLRDIAIVDEAARGRVAYLFLSTAAEESQPPEVRAFAVRYLVEMRAREVSSDVERLLDDPLFTRGVAISPDRLKEEWRAGSPASLSERKQAIMGRFHSLYPER